MWTGSVPARDETMKITIDIDPDQPGSADVLRRIADALEGQQTKPAVPSTWECGRPWWGVVPPPEHFTFALQQVDARIDASVCTDLRGMLPVVRTSAEID